MQQDSFQSASRERDRAALILGGDRPEFGKRCVDRRSTRKECVFARA
jgi:hypothetical protein